MKRHTLPMPVLGAMHPGNPHGLRFVQGDTGDTSGGGTSGGAGGDGGEQQQAPEVNEHGFPDKTPIKDMSVEQQAAYWKHQARKHEDTAKARADYESVKAERDQLKQAGMTDAEKAIESARAEGLQAGRAESVKSVTKAKVEAALSRRGLDEKRVAAIVGPLDHTYFLTDSGEVDAAKVSDYASGFGGGQQWPDMGQGRRGDHAADKSVDAGRELYRDRHQKK